jgi:hypothetical protein
MLANSISHHRVTDNWDVRYDGKWYDVTRTDYPESHAYATHWQVVAIRSAPNGGQYNQYLTDSSKLKLTIIKFVNQQLDQQQVTK